MCVSNVLLARNVLLQILVHENDSKILKNRPFSPKFRPEAASHFLHYNGDFVMMNVISLLSSKIVSEEFPEACNVKEGTQMVARIFSQFSPQFSRSFTI